MPTPRARALVALAVAASVVAACSWSVPADPGLLARRRGVAVAEPAPVAPPGAPVAAAPDEGARAVYVDRCSRCHEPFDPTHLSATEWPAAVRKYGPRAGLFGAERERVLAWLQAHAR